MNLTVISTDGYPIEPVTVDSFVSSAGERFDVVIDVENDTNRSKPEAYINHCFIFKFC